MTNLNPESSPADLPEISLIVLNYNGIEHLQECLKSLLALDYPENKREIILVDNASSDDSVAYVHEHFPSVRIIQNTSNLGFAAGNNVGAAGATGEYVVFLNNDMSVDRYFAFELVKAIRTSPDAVCAGARILNWNGTQIDFDGAAGHFAGYAYQVGFGEPVDCARPPEVCPILYACGGALLIDRQVFLDVGGFDEDFFMVYEDFDLGWRLWLLGYKVLYAPKAVVNHRHHGTMSSISNHRKAVLYKRNSLLSALKNYSDDNMTRVLAVILFANNESVLAQATAQGQVNLDDFAIASALKLKQTTADLDKTNLATIVAIHDVVELLPKMMKKRRFVQAKRVRTDEQIAALFRWPFRYWPDVSTQMQYQLVDAFGLQDIYESAPRRVLIISSDILPYPGFPTVGSGLRAWGLGQGLISCGHEVFFSMPKAAITGREELAPPEVVRIAWEHHTMMSIVHQVKPDVIVVCNWAILPLLSTELLSIPVILDQHGPHMLEREYQHYGDYGENARSKLDALRRSDFFTCAGYKQQSYFSKWLADAGWTESERAERSAAIPVSLSPNLPERQPAAEFTFVYGGVFLPWQDPSVSLSTLVEVLDKRNSGKLLFYGGRHPVYPVDPGIFESLIAQLQRSPHVQVCGMVSHDALIDSYTRAHVAIDLMKRNPERELAFTTRTVEYLWCGLPVIYNDYSELSDYIREYNAGWTVDPEDRQAITRVIEEICDNPADVIERGRNAQRLAHERLNWSNTIAPLDYFIRHPRMRWRPQQTRPVPPQIIARNMHYLLREAKLHYKRSGPLGLWKEGTAFLKRQVRI
jgi:GT2 family glycosyltransferase/glycosyltransferase involved in cell wall biosynthesis